MRPPPTSTPRLWLVFRLKNLLIQLSTTIFCNIQELSFVAVYSFATQMNRGNVSERMGFIELLQLSNIFANKKASNFSHLIPSSKSFMNGIKSMMVTTSLHQVKAWRILSLSIQS